jgi:recombination protein RecT
MNQTIKDLKQRAKLPAKQAGGATVAEFFEANKPAMAAVLPKHVSPERMLKVALGAVRAVPKLLECTTESLFGAVIQCSALGLEPNTVLGHAYLIPFANRKAGRTDVQMIIGYKGLIDLARRSGQIVSIAAHEVCENDEFDFSYGLEETLKHRPALGDRGPILAFYAVAKLVGGGYAFEVMSVAEVDRIKASTQSKGQWGPWKDHYPEMGRKTAIRRLSKYLPLSIEFNTASALDGLAETGEDQNLGAVLEGDFSVHDESSPRRDEPGDEPAHDARTPVETKTEPALEEWPQQIPDEETGELRWADSAGHFFDPKFHGMSRDGQTPSVTSAGAFRARRGAGKPIKTEPQAAQDEQEPIREGGPMVSANGLADRVEGAHDAQALDEIEGLARNLDNAAERNAVQVIIQRRRKVLGL